MTEELTGLLKENGSWELGLIRIQHNIKYRYPYIVREKERKINDKNRKWRSGNFRRC